jgi:hypothetical protein
MRYSCATGDNTNKKLLNFFGSFMSQLIERVTGDDTESGAVNVVLLVLCFTSKAKFRFFCD